MPEIIVAADIVGIIKELLELIGVDPLFKFGMQRKRSHGRVLAHERELELADRFLHGIRFVHIAHDSLGFLQVRRKQQHANDNARALLHHRIERRFRELGVRWSLRIAARRMGFDVAKIDQIGIDEPIEQGDRLRGLIARSVVHERDGKPRFPRELRRLNDLGHIVRRRYEVHVECALVLQFQKNAREATHAHIDAAAAVRDRLVLTIHAMQRAIREENGPAARFARNRRLLPKMKGCPSDAQPIGRTAHTPLTRYAIHTASTGAEHAMLKQGDRGIRKRGRRESSLFHARFVIGRTHQRPRHRL